MYDVIAAYRFVARLHNLDPDFEIWTFKVQILAQTLKRSQINTKVNSKSRLFKVSLEWSKHTKIWVQILEPCLHAKLRIIAHDSS